MGGFISGGGVLIHCYLGHQYKPRRGGIEGFHVLYILHKLPSVQDSTDFIGIALRVCPDILKNFNRTL